MKKRHVREVERDTKTKKFTNNVKMKGYYTQGDDKTESNYNQSAEENI